MSFPIVRVVLARLNIYRRLNALEGRMSKTDDAIAALDEATTGVADRIDSLLDQISGVDESTAAKITAETDKLRGLAADPDNPVPADPGEGPTDPS